VFEKLLFPSRGVVGTPEAAKHKMDHADIDHVFARFWVILVVLAQSTIAIEPPKGSLHDPPLREHLEADRVIRALDDREYPSTRGPHPVNQGTGIAAIGPNQFQTRKFATNLAQNQSCSVSILNARRMDHHCDDQPECVHENVPLAAIDLLPPVVTVYPPFSVVFTD
jgi:hypothetical protein